MEKKMVYWFETRRKSGDWFGSCFSFDLEECRQNAAMEWAHTSRYDRNGLEAAFIAGYAIPVADGMTAEEAYSEYTDDFDPTYNEDVLGVWE